jgi:hypothetical protein
MASMRVKIDVAVTREPAVLRVTDPRSEPRLCEAQRFIVPMRDENAQAPRALPPGTVRLARPQAGWPPVMFISKS